MRTGKYVKKGIVGRQRTAMLQVGWEETYAPINKSVQKVTLDVGFSDILFEITGTMRCQELLHYWLGAS